MSRFRFTQIEFEVEQGSEELIRAAFQAAGLASLPAVAPSSESVAGARPAVTAAPDPPPLQASATTRKNGKRGRPKLLETKAAPAPVTLRQSPGGGDSIGTRILAELQKKPHSSPELAKALKLEPSAIYASVHVLKKNGQVESRNDDSDGGTRRYFLAGERE